MSLKKDCIELLEIVLGDDKGFGNDNSCIEITDIICAKILPEDISLSLYEKKHIVKWISNFYIYKTPIQ